MIDPTLTTAALASAEAIIHSALRYDPGTRLALAALAPHVLAIKFTAPDCTLYLVPSEQGLDLRGHYEGDITTQLQGSVAAMITLLKSDRVNLKDSGVQIIGSTHFIAELQQILKQVDIDWEEILTQVLGDVVGHQGAEILRAKISWSADRAHNIQRLTSEFLTQELRALPSKPELQYFYQQVDDVRLDVDRAEARLQQLFARLQQKAAPQESHS